MKHISEHRVYYGDTDAYGVVWHGAYIRWLEGERVEFCRKLGIDFVELKEKDILMPVTNMSLRYKSPARIDDTLIIETYISEISPISAAFTQIVRNKKDNSLCVKAQFEVVMTNNQGKLYRRIPENLAQILKSAQETEV